MGERHEEAEDSLYTTIIELQRRVMEVTSRLTRLEEDYKRLSDSVKSIGARSGEGFQPTPSQARIISYINSKDRGVTSKELQEELELAKSTVSIGVKELLDLGAIHRIPSTDADSRYKYMPRSDVPPEIARTLDLIKKSARQPK